MLFAYSISATNPFIRDIVNTVLVFQADTMPDADIVAIRRAQERWPISDGWRDHKAVGVEIAADMLNANH